MVVRGAVGTQVPSKQLPQRSALQPARGRSEVGTVQASRPTPWTQILTPAPGEPGAWQGSASSSVKGGKVSPAPLPPGLRRRVTWTVCVMSEWVPGVQQVLRKSGSSSGEAGVSTDEERV